MGLQKTVRSSYIGGDRLCVGQSVNEGATSVPGSEQLDRRPENSRQCTIVYGTPLLVPRRAIWSVPRFAACCGPPRLARLEREGIRLQLIDVRNDQLRRPRFRRNATLAKKESSLKGSIRAAHSRLTGITGFCFLPIPFRKARRRSEET